MTVQLEVTDTFKTIKDFNKQYKELRNQIMIRHGYELGSKVKLVNAVRLLQSFDSEYYVNCTMVKSDMTDRIKMYAGDDRVTFKLFLFPDDIRHLFGYATFKLLN